jgi:hypothetical protein
MLSLGFRPWKKLGEFVLTYKDISFCLSDSEHSTASTIKFFFERNERGSSAAAGQAQFLSEPRKGAWRLQRCGVVWRVVNKWTHFGVELECFDRHNKF